MSHTADFPFAAAPTGHAATAARNTGGLLRRWATAFYDGLLAQRQRQADRALWRLAQTDPGLMADILAIQKRQQGL